MVAWYPHTVLHLHFLLGCGWLLATNDLWVGVGFVRSKRLVILVIM